MYTWRPRSLEDKLIQQAPQVHSRSTAVDPIYRVEGSPLMPFDPILPIWISSCRPEGSDGQQAKGYEGIDFSYPIWGQRCVGNEGRPVIRLNPTFRSDYESSRKLGHWNDSVIMPIYETRLERKGYVGVTLGHAYMTFDLPAERGSKKTEEGAQKSKYCTDVIWKLLCARCSFRGRLPGYTSILKKCSFATLQLHGDSSEILL